MLPVEEYIFSTPYDYKHARGYSIYVKWLFFLVYPCKYSAMSFQVSKLILKGEGLNLDT